MNTKELRRSIGNQIAAARKAAGFTQLQAAELLRFTKHSIAQFETGNDGGFDLMIAQMNLYGVRFSDALFEKVASDPDVPRIIERKKKS